MISLGLYFQSIPNCSVYVCICLYMCVHTCKCRISMLFEKAPGDSAPPLALAISLLSVTLPTALENNTVSSLYR